MLMLMLMMMIRWWWWWFDDDDDDDDDDDEEDEEDEDEDEKKSRKRVFDRCFNWCFESAAPLRMIREPSSSSSNTNGRRMVWPQVATSKATGWNLLQEPRCADNADVPTLVGAPVWGSTRELLWKALSFGAGKKGEHMVNTSRIFLLVAVDPLILKEDASSWRKKLKTATGAALLFPNFVPGCCSLKCGLAAPS